MKDRVTLTLDRELIAKIDETRGLIPRSAWIEDRLKKVSSGLENAVKA